VFSGPGGQAQTLYYFKTDLSNSGVRTSGFLQFLARLGIGDVFIKAASYLLHSPAFSVVRDFLLGAGASVVQDDTGIPVTYFQKAGWQLQPFGEYVGPIPMFRGHYQPKLDELFEVAGAPPIGFGVGYRWRPNQSHLLLAVSKEPRVVPAEPAAPAKATGPKDGTAPPPAPGSIKPRGEIAPKIAPKNARAKASKGTADDPSPGPRGAKNSPSESQAPFPFPGPLHPAVPQTAHGAWRSLVLGGLIGVVLAGVFGPGGFAAGLTFVLQLGGIGGVMWLIASNIAGQEAVTAPPS
jgi:hypothetical protein